jgi:hypothetical protein
MCNYSRKPYEGCVIPQIIQRKCHYWVRTPANRSRAACYILNPFEALTLWGYHSKPLRNCFTGYEWWFFPAGGQLSRTGLGAAAPSTETSHCPGPCRVQILFWNKLLFQTLYVPTITTNVVIYLFPGWFEKFSGNCCVQTLSLFLKISDLQTNRSPEDFRPGGYKEMSSFLADQ